MTRGRVHLPLLSKSRYLYGLQCDKRLYLDCYEPELGGMVSSSQQRLFDQGHEVGVLATRRYPGGVRIDFDRSQFAEAADATQRAMADPAIPAIFEAALAYAGIRIRVDILVRQPRGWWRLEEVTSSTSVADVHVSDLAVQLFVLDGCGIRVSKAGIVHLDRRYSRTTDALDVDALFAFVELRKIARSTRAEIVTNLRRWRRQLARRSPPDIAPGRHCFDPYECPYSGHCIAPPGRFSLRRLPADQKLIDTNAARSPDDVRRLPDDVRLTRHQARAIDCLISGHEYVSPHLGDAIEIVKHPIHFLDFETFSPAIPRYARTRTYHSLPFQWSDHVLHADGRIEHHAFLHAFDSDPRPSFVEALLDALGSTGTIVVFTSFENTQLRALTATYRRYRKRIRKLQRRLFDLHRVVREHYYHQDLDGSFSLKALVPVLVPSLKYGMIAAGTEASAAYEEMIHPATLIARRATLERALLKYCRTDTLAMLKLWLALQRRVQRGPASGSVS
jgi:hypothetical protein